MSAGFQSTRTRRRLLILPLLLAAAGCAHDRVGSRAASNEKATASTKTAPLAATPDLSPSDRLDLAVNLLQNGDAERAKIELKACLDDAPDSRAAKLLLSEIEKPIAKLYPKQNFTVTLGRHETLFGLAGTYLGEPLAFYGLARYNDIAEPGMIMAGEQIRIPATPEALAAQNGFLRAEEMAEPDQPPQDQSAPDAVKAQAPASSPPAAAAPAPAAPPDPWTQFKSALSQRRYSDAARLADANAFDPRRDRASILADTYMRAAAAENRARAAARGHAKKAGDIFLRILNQPEKARASFQLALSLNPSDAAAKAGLKQANAQVTEQYYRRGMIAFQHQDLDGAIAAWNVVLAIDPKYRDAQLNRDEAVQLKANLLKLKG